VLLISSHIFSSLRSKSVRQARRWLRSLEQLYRRMELYRMLVTEKVNQGELAAELLGELN
jgi:hypothetical protein